MSGEQRALHVRKILLQQCDSVRLRIVMVAPREYHHAEMHGLWDTADEHLEVPSTYRGVTCCKIVASLSVVLPVAQSGYRVS